MKKKIFISQPISGKTDEEITGVRNKVVEDLENIFGEFELLSGYFKDSNEKPLYLLGEALKILSTADLVYFCNGWQNSNGCRVEHLAAELYNICMVEA